MTNGQSSRPPQGSSSSALCPLPSAVSVTTQIAYSMSSMVGLLSDRPRLCASTASHRGQPGDLVDSLREIRGSGGGAECDEDRVVTADGAEDVFEIVGVDGARQRLGGGGRSLDDDHVHGR